jgi:uronate dehydrogenase
MDTLMTKKPFQRIVLTGAAGHLGSALRASLRNLCGTLVLSDRADLKEAATDNEIFVPCEISDHTAVGHLLQNADLVVHMGAAPQECAFDTLLHSNLIGQFNLYDNALTQGVKRIVLASTNHVSGYYQIDERVTPSMPNRPDSLYAVTKCYGEALARFYQDRHGIESVCLRIGQCTPRPINTRGLDCWLSHGDLCELVRCAALTPQVGFAIVYGVSANTSCWWEGDDAGRIGYQPRDNAEHYREELIAKEPPAGAWARWQGGKSLERDYRDPGTWYSRPVST